jgi:hypothetical protein
VSSLRGRCSRRSRPARGGSAGGCAPVVAPRHLRKRLARLLVLPLAKVFNLRCGPSTAGRFGARCRRSEREPAPG